MAEDGGQGGSQEVHLQSGVMAGLGVRTCREGISPTGGKQAVVQDALPALSPSPPTSLGAASGAGGVSLPGPEYVFPGGLCGCVSPTGMVLGARPLGGDQVVRAGSVTLEDPH